MSVKTSEVYRCLEKKTYVLGFEIVDLFMVFSLLAVLNLILRGVPYKFFFTWGPAALFALLLRITKAGKPENYLLHLVLYHVRPRLLSAFTLAPRKVRFQTTQGVKTYVVK